MKRYLSLLFGVASMLLGGEAALGCDCVYREGGVPQALKEAAAVFSGQAIRGRDRRVSFRVKRAWKGVWAGGEVEVRGVLKEWGGPLVVSECDYYFETGKSYLVYARRVGDKLETSICERTKPIQEAEQEIKELDKLKVRGAGRARRKQS